MLKVMVSVMYQDAGNRATSTLYLIIVQEWMGGNSEMELAEVKLNGKLNCPFTGLYRPRWLQKVDAPRIFRQSAHEGGKVIGPTHQSSFHL
jgi:hypothetical protein